MRHLILLSCFLATASLAQTPDSCVTVRDVKNATTAQAEALLADILCQNKRAISSDTSENYRLEKLALLIAELRAQAVPPVVVPVVPPGPGSIAARYEGAFGGCGYRLLRSRDEWADTATADGFTWFAYKQFGSPVLVPKGSNPDSGAASEAAVRLVLARVWAEESRCAPGRTIGDFETVRMAVGVVSPPR